MDTSGLLTSLGLLILKNKTNKSNNSLTQTKYAIPPFGGRHEIQQEPDEQDLKNLILNNSNRAIEQIAEGTMLSQNDPSYSKDNILNTLTPSGHKVITVDLLDVQRLLRTAPQPLKDKIITQAKDTMLKQSNPADDTLLKLLNGEIAVGKKIKILV